MARISTMEEIFKGNQELYSEVDKYFKEIDYDYHDNDNEIQKLMNNTIQKIETKPKKAVATNDIIEKKKASHKLAVKAFDSRRAEMTFKPASPQKKTRTSDVKKIVKASTNNKVLIGTKNPHKVQHVIAGANKIFDKCSKTETIIYPKVVPKVTLKVK